MKDIQIELEKTPIIIMRTLPVNGWWDGGEKFYFKFESTLCQDKKGKFVRWESWQANYWFTSGFGRSWNHAASIAIKKINRNFLYNARYEVQYV